MPPTEFTDGKPYRHEVPEKYSPMSPFKREWEKIPNDKLMYDLITNYAKEGKSEGQHKPNGQFYLDSEGAKKVS